MKHLSALAFILLSACVVSEPAEVPQRRAIAAEVDVTQRTLGSFAPQIPQRVTRSNSSVAADFLELSFRMESGREIPRFTRFEGPVTVALAGSVPATAPKDLASLLARLRAEAGLHISQVPSSADASITVEFLPRAQMRAVVPHAACFVVPNVGSWAEYRAARGTGLTDWTRLHTRTRASVFIPSDVAPQEARDCLHEELAQAMGPLNDLYSLSDSVFNDDNFNTVLTSFDMLVLRATYAPELHNGMSRSEVAAQLPRILARLNPSGGAVGAAPSAITPREWINQIEAAISPRGSNTSRRAAAQRALSFAQSKGWTDNRRAFSHFVLARLSLATEVEQSVIHFAEAANFYARLPGGSLHLAHVDMQMAAFALTSGQYDRALELVSRAEPAATREQNAAVLAMLKMVRAAALDATGRKAEANAARLDSLPWARYGFGSDAQARARMAEVNALAKRGAMAARD